MWRLAELGRVEILSQYRAWRQHIGALALLALGCGASGVAWSGALVITPSDDEQKAIAPKVVEDGKARLSSGGGSHQNLVFYRSFLPNRCCTSFAPLMSPFCTRYIPIPPLFCTHSVMHNCI